MRPLVLIAVMLLVMGVTMPLAVVWADTGYTATAPLQQSEEEKESDEEEEPDCE